MLTPVQRLKLALFTDGVVVTPEARRQISGEGKHGRPLTLADYASASGISMELDGRIWVNAPIPCPRAGLPRSGERLGRTLHFLGHHPPGPGAHLPDRRVRHFAEVRP